VGARDLRRAATRGDTGRANSEIVIPFRDPTGRIVGVLDVDSADFDSFDAIDVDRLQRILGRIYS
jgi:GAF domain-containing protein